MASRCFQTNNTSTPWATIVALLLALAGAQGNLLVVLYTGLKSTESRLSILFASMATVAAALALFRGDGHSAGIFSFPISAMSSYLQEVYSAFIDPTVPQSEVRAEPIAQYLVLLFIFLLTCGLVIPAIKFSQVLKSLLFASTPLSTPSSSSSSSSSSFSESIPSSYERAPRSRLPALVADAIFPLFLGIIYNETFWSPLGDDKSAYLLFNSILFTKNQRDMFLFSSVAGWCFIHVSVLRVYLQNFLLAALRMVVISDVAGRTAESTKTLHSKIMVSVTYIYVYVLFISHEFFCILILSLSYSILSYSTNIFYSIILLFSNYPILILF